MDFGVLATAQVVVDALGVGVLSHFDEVRTVLSVAVGVVVQRPGHEGVAITHVFGLVQENKGRRSVLVEDSLESVGGRLHELVPLGFEEA